MPYTVITDEAEIRDAFEKLRDTFQEDAEQVGTRYGCPTYFHRNHGLLGAFGRVNDNRYTILFGYKGTFPIFHADVPIRGFTPRTGKGLFVRDTQGIRFLAHLGIFGSRGNNEKKERLRAHTDLRVEVTDAGTSPPISTITSALITRIDGIPPNALADHIDRFTKILVGNEEPDSGKTTARSALNTILYGPPGTGKTYATFRRCVEICDGREERSDEEIRRRYKVLVDEGRIEFVTFHQSYGYEEFVEGLRPETGSAEEGVEAGAGFRLEPTPGVLKRIAKRTRGPSGPTGEAEAPADAKPHVLVIDEINRANVSKVMGELITLLEEDKREGKRNEIAVTLPHSGERFTLPANLYILGTMNTADRSIALLDTALRRRFEFEELAPDPDRLKDAVKATGIDLPAVLRAINERLEYLVDRDHLIGHAWLMGARTKADVDRIMRHKIIPLIAEYFHDDWQKVRAVLGGTNDFVRRKRLSPPPGLDDTDADEDRHSWTVVQEEFADDAYEHLVSGPARNSGRARDPAQAQDSEQEQGSGPIPDTEPESD